MLALTAVRGSIVTGLWMKRRFLRRLGVFTPAWRRSVISLNILVKIGIGGGVTL